jgi:hypothetical protein
MLLFTFSSLMSKIAEWFYGTFHFLEHFNRNMNIAFIVIAAIGAIGWVIKQHQLNKEAERQGTFK